MARAIKLINALVGLFDIDGVLVLKTEYSTQHNDGAITPDCYIVDSGEYFWGGVDSVEERNNLMVTPIDLPTLNPPNEWVSRLRELDELYTKVRIVTGFTVEQLLEMFTAGYTLEKPDYSKASEEMASLAETAPPNEPLTLGQLREMEDPVWCVCKTVEGFEGFWCLCDHGYILTPARQIFDVKEIPHWVFYRRPPEGEEDA